MDGSVTRGNSTHKIKFAVVRSSSSSHLYATIWISAQKWISLSLINDGTTQTSKYFFHVRRTVRIWRRRDYWCQFGFTCNSSYHLSSSVMSQFLHQIPIWFPCSVSHPLWQARSQSSSFSILFTDFRHFLLHIESSKWDDFFFPKIRRRATGVAACSFSDRRMQYRWEIYWRRYQISLWYEEKVNNDWFVNFFSVVYSVKIVIKA